MTQSNSDVLHVITGLAVGGAESMLTSLLIAKHYQGEPQHVVSLSPGGANAARLRDIGVRVTELRMRPRRPSGWQLLRLARLIWRERPRIVQSWMYHADLAATIALLWTGLQNEVRLFWGLRCSDMDVGEYGLRLRFVIRACAYLSSIPDTIVSNSTVGSEFHVRIGYTPKRLIVIDNGIDIERFSPNERLRSEVRAELGIPPERPVIAHVARVDPMKDHANFLQAFNRLHGVTALAIGQGTENLADHPNIFRLGRRHDVPRLLTAADYIVSSSAFGEGFSNALAEGMAVGLVPIATDVGDSRRIVSDTGFVVPPRNPAALASALSRLISEPFPEHGARRHAARARIMQEFSLERAVSGFDDLYRT